jgi:hypothetical protein
MKMNVYLDDSSTKEIEFNSIKFVPVVIVPDNMKDNTKELIQEYNRSILADGVKGVKCIYNGRLNWILPDGVKLDMPEYYLNYYVSSCELYENGMINVYCRMRSDDKLVGFILVR